MSDEHDFEKELIALRAAVLEDLTAILEPVLETMKQIVSNMEHEKQKTQATNRINDPRFRRKKGRTTWK